MFHHIDALRSEYHLDGLTVLERFLDIEQCAEIVGRIMDSRHASVERDLTIPANDVSPERKLKYRILDAHAISVYVPEVIGIYWTLPSLVAPIALEPVRLSPYEDSAVNIKIYQGPGFEHGWHYDTNGITALLYLNNSDDTTECVTLKRDPDFMPDSHLESLRHLHIQPRAGDMLLMQGRKVLHRVPPSKQGALRIVVPFNLYTRDTWRPEGLDQYLLDKKP